MWGAEGEDGWFGGGSWGIAAAVVVAAGLLGWLFLRRGRSSTKAPLPPGSLGWPIVGETMDFMRGSSTNNWMAFYNERVAKYGEVFKTNLFLSRAVVVPAPEGNKYLFTNENKTVVAGPGSLPPSVSMLLGPESMSNVMGEKHKRLRRFYGNFFNPEGLRRFIPQMCKIAKEHFKQHWDGRDEIRLGVMTKQFAFEVACYLFVGMEAGPELDALNKAFTDFNDGLFALPIKIPGTSFYKAMAGRKYIDRVSDTLLARRRQKMQGEKPRANQDLLDVLLSASDEDGHYMSDDCIKDNLVNLLFAGHDTSAYTLAMVARMLHHNPHCVEGVLKEHLEIGKGRLDDDDDSLTWQELRSMKYTWAVIQETMRIEPTVLGGFRAALQDIEFAGYTLPKGWTLMFLAAASHRSEKFFPNPDKFDPSRFEDGSVPQPYTYIPFGGGSRLCLGYEFARIEMLIFIHYVVLNYEFEMVEPDEKLGGLLRFQSLRKGARLSFGDGKWRDSLVSHPLGYFALT